MKLPKRVPSLVPFPARGCLHPRLYFSLPGIAWHEPPFLFFLFAVVASWGGGGGRFPADQKAQIALRLCNDFAWFGFVCRTTCCPTIIYRLMDRQSRSWTLPDTTPACTSAQRPMASASRSPTPLRCMSFVSTAPFCRVPSRCPRELALQDRQTIPHGYKKVSLEIVLLLPNTFFPSASACILKSCFYQQSPFFWTGACHYGFRWCPTSHS